MKRRIYKSGLVESMGNLYENLQAAHISNMEAYLKGTILETGLRLQGDDFSIKIEGERVIVPLGACIFPNYEIFVASPNTELSLEMPDFDNTNLPYHVILSQEYIESENRYVIPLRDAEEGDLLKPALRKVGVKLIISTEAPSGANKIHLGYLKNIGSEILVTDLRHLSALRILSKYMDWNLTAMLPVDVSALDTFVVRSPAAESDGAVTPPVNKLAYIRVTWGIPETLETEDSKPPLYYKVRLTPIEYLNGYPWEPIARTKQAIDKIIRFDLEIFSGNIMYTDCLCAEGVIYRASVHRVANSVGIVVSEDGSTMNILSGMPEEEESPPAYLSMEILKPNDAYGASATTRWDTDLIYIRPQVEALTGLSDLDVKYQLFIQERTSPYANDIVNKNYLFYEGSPKGCFYAPRGNKDFVTIYARLIGQAGFVIAASEVHSVSQTVLTVYSPVENILAFQSPHASALENSPQVGKTGVVAGYFLAPYDMIVSKILIRNPFKDFVVNDIWNSGYEVGGVNPPGELVLSGDIGIVVGDYPVPILAGENTGEVIKDFSNAYVQGNYPIIRAGETITLTFNDTSGAGPTFVPDGLIALIYTRKVLQEG